MSKPVHRFEDLLVYRKAFAHQQEVFEASKGFPKEERYSLTDQSRRSSRSIGASATEAWKKRRYEAHFIAKLSDADMELGETEHWLHTAMASDYLQSIEHDRFIEAYAEVGRLWGSMMNNRKPWLLKPNNTET